MDKRIFNTLTKPCLALFVLALLLAGSTPSTADEAAKKLSLAGAVAASLGANTNLKQSEQSYLDSMSRLKSSSFLTTYGIASRSNLGLGGISSGLWGLVSGNVTLNTLSGGFASLDLLPFTLGSDRGGVELTLTRPLMSGKGLLSEKANLVASARNDVSIQNKQLYQTQQSTVVGVVDAYYRAVLAREQIQVLARSVDIVAKAADGARKRADAGLVAGIEVPRAETRVAETKNQLNIQAQQEKQALDKLMLAIGEGVSAPPELTDPLPEGTIEIPSLVDAVKKALANRSELTVYDTQLEDQVRKLAIANDRLRPRLDMVTSYNSTARNTGFISASGLDVGAFYGGIEISYPIDKRIGLEDKATAARGVEVLRKLRTFQTEQIIGEVQRAYRDVETAKMSKDIFDQDLKVARDRLAQAQRMVEEALADNREILDAESALTGVESQRLNARMNLYLASVQLRYAMGEDLTTIGTR